MMAMVPIERVIKKSDHMPLRERRDYLIQLLDREKGRWRRKRVADVLRAITTRLLKMELREARRPKGTGRVT